MLIEYTISESSVESVLERQVSVTGRVGRSGLSVPLETCATVQQHANEGSCQEHVGRDRASIGTGNEPLAIGGQPSKDTEGAQAPTLNRGKSDRLSLNLQV